MEFSSYWNPAIHNELPQIKSRIAAAKLKPSDITMNPDNSCDISGSGKDPYHATITSCTCPDFLINKKQSAPCKHIYRLASDLGKYNLLPARNPTGSASVQREIPKELSRWEREFLSGNISAEKYVKLCEALTMK